MKFIIEPLKKLTFWDWFDIVTKTLAAWGVVWLFLIMWFSAVGISSKKECPPCSEVKQNLVTPEPSMGEKLDFIEGALK